MKIIVTSTVFCWLSQTPKGPPFSRGWRKNLWGGPDCCTLLENTAPSGSCYVVGRQEREVFFVGKSSVLR